MLVGTAVSAGLRFEQSSVVVVLVYVHDAVAGTPQSSISTAQLSLLLPDLRHTCVGQEQGQHKRQTPRLHICKEL